VSPISNITPAKSKYKPPVLLKLKAHYFQYPILVARCDRNHYPFCLPLHLMDFLFLKLFLFPALLRHERGCMLQTMLLMHSCHFVFLISLGQMQTPQRFIKQDTPIHQYGLCLIKYNSLLGCFLNSFLRYFHCFFFPRDYLVLLLCDDPS